MEANDNQVILEGKLFTKPEFDTDVDGNKFLRFALRFPYLNTFPDEDAQIRNYVDCLVYDEFYQDLILFLYDHDPHAYIRVLDAHLIAWHTKKPHVPNAFGDDAIVITELGIDQNRDMTINEVSLRGIICDVPTDAIDTDINKHLPSYAPQMDEWILTFELRYATYPKYQNPDDTDNNFITVIVHKSEGEDSYDALMEYGLNNVKDMIVDVQGSLRYINLDPSTNDYELVIDAGWLSKDVFPRP